MLELRIGGKRRSLLWLRDLAEAGRIPSLRPDGGNLRFNLRAVEACVIRWPRSARTLRGRR